MAQKVISPHRIIMYNVNYNLIANGIRIFVKLNFTKVSSIIVLSSVGIKYSMRDLI